MEQTVVRQIALGFYGDMRLFSKNINWGYSLVRNGVGLNRWSRFDTYLGNASFAFWLLGVCKLPLVESVMIKAAMGKEYYSPNENA